MLKPEYAAAIAVLRDYHRRLLDKAAADIGQTGNATGDLADVQLDEMLDEYARKICNVNQLRLSLEGPPLCKPSDLRVATIRFQPDRITDTLNQWFRSHQDIEIDSIHFTQLDGASVCLVMHRVSQPLGMTVE